MKFSLIKEVYEAGCRGQAYTDVFTASSTYQRKLNMHELPSDLDLSILIETQSQPVQHHWQLYSDNAFQDNISG